MRVAHLFAILVWCFSIQTTFAGQKTVKAAFDFIQAITLKEDWSIKDIHQIATKLTAISGNAETELVGIGFPDKDSMKLSLHVYASDAQEKPKDRRDQEPVGIWSITLKKKKGAYVHETHAWSDV